MTGYYELGVKLALDTLMQTSSKTRSSSSSNTGSAVKTKLPKIEKPKLPSKTDTMTAPTTAPPQPLPTRSPDTGPWGMRYGGRGTSVRSM